MTESVSQRIKELRRGTEPRLTQREVAEIIGVVEGTYKSWEYGRAVPPLDMIKKLADLYKTSPGHIFFGESNNQIMVIEECPETAMPMSQVRELVTKLDKIYQHDSVMFDDIFISIHRSWRVFCEIEEKQQKIKKSKD